jgi:hypothetical protein
MDEYSGLTFDWDDVSFEDEIVQKELKGLVEIFGQYSVWYRESSSKTGLHILIGELIFDDQLGSLKLVPLAMDIDDQLHYREQTDIECRGRMFSDSMRQIAGLRTSRIFTTKNGLQVGTWQRFK